MKRLFIRGLALLSLALLGGCANVMFSEQDRQAMGGRYSEMAGDGERGSAGVETGADLVGKCIAYSRLKVYDRLFSCLDRLDARIASGDRLIQHPGFFSWNYPENISAIPGLLRAETQVEFGDYKRAIAVARASYVALPGIAWTDKDRTNSWERRYRIRALGILALAYAFDGEREAALSTLAQLQSIEPSSYEFWMTPGGVSTAIAKEKRFMLARANVALGRYEQVLTQGSDFWEGFGALSEGLLGYSLFAFIDLPKEFMQNKALFETGRIQEAKVGYDRLLSREETRANGEIYWPILYDRGRIELAQGRLAEAIVFFRQAIEVIEGQRSSIHTEANKIGFVGDKQAVYAKLIALLVEQGRAAEAFDYVERSKSRALVDMLSAKKDFTVRGQSDASVLLTQLDAVELEAQGQEGGGKTDAPRSGMRNLKVARQALQSAAPELSTLVTVGSVPQQELQALIAGDETLVEYYYSGGELSAFVLDHSGLTAVRLEGNGLAQQVQMLRDGLMQPDSAVWQATSRQLYDRLWQPLEGRIASKKVIVVGHGALHYLPFGVLGAADGSLLIDRYSLRFLPSASVMKFLRPATAGSESTLLALGNPDLGDANLDLRFAEGEARLVAGMDPTSRLLVRGEATETNFKNLAGRYARLHFATHGKFQAESPLNSGLYLAKDAGNDGVLTVGELYAMDLHADLITLSACETGLGRVSNGDDVVGLTRGFLYAGGRSIVASLWSVDDEATADLMRAFYANLVSLDKAEALRQAQLQVRSAFPHPYYWAAFQLTGRAD